MLSNAFAIIISSLSELYVSFLLEPACCQLLAQQSPGIPAPPAWQLRLASFCFCLLNSAKLSVILALADDLKYPP